jgi:hypothetical protein
MNHQPPTPLASNDGELMRRLMLIPYHRRWCLEVSLTALSVVDCRAPWAARFIKPIAPIVGGALRIVADVVFTITQHIHIRAVL